jgi:hypothetical protein
MLFFIPYFMELYYNIVKIAANIITIIIKIAMYFANILCSIIKYILSFITPYLDHLYTNLNSFDDSWINPSLPNLPDWFRDSMSILNGIFPLDIFLQSIVILILLWAWALTIKFIIRIITLGQA